MNALLLIIGTALAGSPYYAVGPQGSTAITSGGACLTDVTCSYAITTTGGATRPLQACSGTCPTWGHSPTLATEGALEADGMAYLDGGATMGGDITLAGYNILAAAAPITDVAAANGLVKCGQNALVTGTHTGGNCVIAAGISPHYITCTGTTALADYVQIYVCRQGSATCAETDKTVGVDFICGPTAGACCQNLAATTAIPGVTMSYASSRVYFTPDVDTTFLRLFFAGGHAGVATNTDDGEVWIPELTLGAGHINDAERNDREAALVMRHSTWPTTASLKFLSSQYLAGWEIAVGDATLSAGAPERNAVGIGGDVFDKPYEGLGFDHESLGSFICWSAGFFSNSGCDVGVSRNGANTLQINASPWGGNGWQGGDPLASSGNFEVRGEIDAGAFPVTDTAATPGIFGGPTAFSGAVTNKGGGDVVIRPGLATRYYTVVSNVAGNTTITLTANGVAVAFTSPGDFVLGTDDTAPQLLVTSTNIAAAVNAHATAKLYWIASASAARVTLAYHKGVTSASIATNQAGRISTTQGTDGTAYLGEPNGNYLSVSPTLTKIDTVAAATGATACGITFGTGANPACLSYYYGQPLFHAANGDSGMLLRGYIADTTSLTISYNSRYGFASAYPTNTDPDLSLGRVGPGLLGIYESTYAGSALLGIVKDNRQSTTQLTLNGSNKITMFTVPAGYTFTPTKIVCRAPSAALDAGDAGGFGCDADATDFVAAQIYGAQLSATTKAIRLEPANNTAYSSCAAAATFGWKATVTDSTAKTMRCDLYGTLE